MLIIIGRKARMRPRARVLAIVPIQPAARARAVAPIPPEADLILSSGEFLLTDTGVEARLRPPLDHFSGHYNWRMLPRGLAVLKLCVVGGDQEVSDVVSFLGISSSTLDRLEKEIGCASVSWYTNPNGEVLANRCEYVSPIVKDVNRLVQWSAELASWCPNAQIRQSLQMLPRLSSHQLSQLVMG